MAKKKSNRASKTKGKSKKRRVNTRKAPRASAKTKRRRIAPKKRVTKKRNTRKRKPLKKSSKKVEYSIISQDGGHYENWYGRVREYLPVKRITDDNADFYIGKVMLDLPEVRNSISFTMFWEISSYTREDGEIIDDRITSVNVTASSHDDLIRAFRQELFRRLNKYKAKIYLRKTWAYSTNETKHVRTKFEKIRPGDERRKKAKILKKKKRRSKRS